LEGFEDGHARITARPRIPDDPARQGHALASEGQPPAHPGRSARRPPPGGTCGLDGEQKPPTEGWVGPSSGFSRGDEAIRNFARTIGPGGVSSATGLVPKTGVDPTPEFRQQWWTHSAERSISSCGVGAPRACCIQRLACGTRRVRAHRRVRRGRQRDGGRTEATHVPGSNLPGRQAMDDLRKGHTGIGARSVSL